jgi:hypothetical protein
MADETSTTTAEATNTDAAQDAPTTVTPTGDATGTNSGTSDRTFTQADLDRIINDRLKQASAKAEKEAAKAQADAEAKVLAEQGKYKELFEKQQAELQAAQQAARANELRLWQRDAAAQTKLPVALAERLKGETLDEMVADAKAILAALPKPAAPDINANSGAGGAPAAGQLSDAEKQELAAVLGVNPRFM